MHSFWTCSKKNNEHQLYAVHHDHHDHPLIAVHCDHDDHDDQLFAVRRDHLVTDSLKEISSKQKDLKKKLKVLNMMMMMMVQLWWWWGWWWWGWSWWWRFSSGFICWWAWLRHGGTHKRMVSGSKNMFSRFYVAFYRKVEIDRRFDFFQLLQVLSFFLH